MYICPLEIVEKEEFEHNYGHYTIYEIRDGSGNWIGTFQDKELANGFISFFNVVNQIQNNC